MKTEKKIQIVKSIWNRMLKGFFFCFHNFLKEIRKIEYIFLEHYSKDGSKGLPLTLSEVYEDPTKPLILIPI